MIRLPKIQLEVLGSRPYTNSKPFEVRGIYRKIFPTLVDLKHFQFSPSIENGEFRMEMTYEWWGILGLGGQMHERQPYGGRHQFLSKSKRYLLLHAIGNFNSLRPLCIDLIRNLGKLAGLGHMTASATGQRLTRRKDLLHSDILRFIAVLTCRRKFLLSLNCILINMTTT